MSYGRSPPKNPQQLKILKNEITEVDPKQIFDSIKAVCKQFQNAEKLQQNISKQLSFLLKKTVGVSVLPINQLVEGLSNKRQLHRYSQPSAVLEDTTYHYRVWVTPPPQFQLLQEFRQPANLKIKEVVPREQDYEVQP